MAFDPLTAAFDIGGKVIDRLWPDPATKAQAMLELQKLQQSGDLAAMAGQVDINKIEAANSNLFVSGWRPAVGWICAGGLGFQFIIAPTLTWLSSVISRPITFPSLDTGTLTTLLVGMLGFGGLRTYEKITGVTK
jgi:hypothetical protein